MFHRLTPLLHSKPTIYLHSYHLRDSNIKRIASIVCASLLTLASHSASASLIFDFGFFNLTGNTSGPIRGEILGLVDDSANQAATAVNITGLGFGFLTNLTTPISTLSDPWSMVFNDFTVENGVITGAQFRAFNLTREGQPGDPFTVQILDMRLTPDDTEAIHAYECFGDGGVLIGCGLQNPSFKGIYLTAGSTIGAFFLREQELPAPATLALFGLGLAGLGWKRRKQA